MRFLYRLSSPAFFYKFASQVTPWLFCLATILLIIGFSWGLFFSPPDYQQGDAVRLMYVHVPCAFISMAIYGLMGVYALLLLVWRVKIAGLMLHACAIMGAWMTLLALITGSLWGRPMWGTWWIWDARLTSELILLFLYGAIIAVGQAYSQKSDGDQLVAWLTLIGIIDLPIIHYSVYWWNTLHQGATLSVFAKSTIDIQMIYPLFISLAGLLLYCLAMIFRYAQNLLLWRERRQRWISVLM